MAYRVREMRAEDICQVAQMESSLFTDGWSEASLRSSLEQAHVKMIVAEEVCEGERQVERESKPQIIGYHIFYQSVDEGDVARIAVDPRYRRQGVGDGLLRYMWKHCVQEGILRVLLEVREGNTAAIALYEKHGFTSIGVRRDYYAQPLEHGVIMEKQLDITTSFPCV